MQRYLKRKIYVFASLIGGVFVLAGVIAGISIVINGNNKLEFGVGNAPVNACDPDVTVNIIVDRFNEDQYLTGFTYSFVDKPACVGYDIETRFITASDQVKNLFATSTLASDPTVLRVFSTSSTSNWQLGKGAFSGIDATVSQLSDSSFQVTFVTPVLLASELGKILTAEIPHLPLGTFTRISGSIEGSNKSWIAVSTNSDASTFYIADDGNAANTGYVYKSTQAFSSFATSSLQKISALPNGSTGYSWSWLSQSESGQYVVAVGQNQRVYFTKDYGSNWDSVTASAYYTRSPNSYGFTSPVTVSADGSIVCLVSTANDATGGSTINIWRNFNLYSKSSSDFKLSTPDFRSVRDCQISADNKYLFILSQNNLYRYLISNLSAGPVNLSGGLISSSPNVFRFGISETGKYVVYGYLYFNGTLNVPRWRYSSDFGANFSDSGGISINQYWSIGQINVSRDGSNVAAALYPAVNIANQGGIFTSNDFGRTFVTSSIANQPVYSLAASNDGAKVIGGTWYLSKNLIYFITSD